jgi:hypothetical protein
VILGVYQAGRLFESDPCQLLGLSRYELDGFPKERGIILAETGPITALAACHRSAS